MIRRDSKNRLLVEKSVSISLLESISIVILYNFVLNDFFFLIDEKNFFLIFQLFLFFN